MKNRTKEIILKSERVYSFFLNLYPKDFKDEYKELLKQLFRDMLREAFESDKKKGILKVWLIVLKDLPLSIINEHLSILRGYKIMNKFWKSYAIAAPSLLALDWGMGVGRFYFPIFKPFFLVINFPFSILYLWLESKSSTWWFSVLGTQAINDEIAQSILFFIMVVVQSIFYTFLFLLIRRIIRQKSTQAVKQ